MYNQLNYQVTVKMPRDSAGYICRIKLSSIIDWLTTQFGSGKLHTQDRRDLKFAVAKTWAHYEWWTTEEIDDRCVSLLMARFGFHTQEQQVAFMLKWGELIVEVHAPNETTSWWPA